MYGYRKIQGQVIPSKDERECHKVSGAAYGEKFSETLNYS